MKLEQVKPLLHYASIVTLFNLAVSQPMFDLLSRNTEFFVARRSTPGDIVALAILLSIAMPVVLVLMEAILAAIHARLGSIFHGILQAILILLILMPLTKGIFVVPGIFILLGTLVASAGILFVISRSRNAQLFLNFLSLSILIIPIVFLANRSVSKLLHRETIGISMPAITSKTPIVMIVFDEFPLNSLLDEKGEIDSGRYPNFKRLRNEATWYRNATAVADATPEAVTAIVTGKYPDPTLLPIAKDHPENLFTLLAGSYELTSFEPITYLCPTELNQVSEAPQGFRERMRRMLLDLSVVYMHVILPREYSAGLPSIQQTWGDFLGDWKRRETNALGRKEQFGRFLQSIKSSQKPALHFLHILLPHTPWEYLPSGKRYEFHGYGPMGVEGFSYAGQSWQNYDSAVTRGIQRHLLQVGFVDRLLGELMDKLKREGTYDSSLLIVTADHGASFKSLGSYRAVTPENYQDILPVPLFIKFPKQNQGNRNEQNVLTIDILPTIADSLGIHLPWMPDGSSLLKNPPMGRTKKRFLKTIFTSDKKWLEFESPLNGTIASLHHQIEIFGTGNWNSVFEMCKPQEVTPQNMFDEAENGKVSVELRNPDDLQHVDLRSGYIPVFLTGRVFFEQPHKDICLGIQINGALVAKTEPYQPDSNVGGVLLARFLHPSEATGTNARSIDRVQAWGVMLPENILHQGKNQIKIIPLKNTRQSSTSHAAWCCD